MHILWYKKQVLIALDQLVNALFGGWADETLSARAHRCKWQKREWLINLLFFLEKDSEGKRNHCEQAYEHEIDRKDLPEEYRFCRNCFRNKEEPL